MNNIDIEQNPLLDTPDLQEFFQNIESVNSFNKFFQLTNLARTVVNNAEKAEDNVEANSHERWRAAFEIIFKSIKPQIDKLDFEIEYMDPDTTYRDDVKAYVEALTDKMNTMKVLLEG